MFAVHGAAAVLAAAPSSLYMLTKNMRNVPHGALMILRASQRK